MGKKNDTGSDFRCETVQPNSKEMETGTQDDLFFLNGL